MAETVEKVVYIAEVAGSEKFSGLAVAIDKAGAAEERFVSTSEKVTRATRTSTDGVEKMIGALDKRMRIKAQWQHSLEQIRRYEEESIGTATRRAAAVDLVTERYHRQAEAITKRSA